MKRFPILCVEDEENDVFFIQRGFELAGISNPLTVVQYGEQAIEYLSGTGAFTDRRKHPLPGMVLLDVKLPNRSGLEVLKWMRAQSLFKVLPVIILSSSDRPPDVEAAYDMGANAYLMKPTVFTDLVTIFKALREFWLVHNQPPPKIVEP